jgi:hypothetical protein
MLVKQIAFNELVYVYQKKCSEKIWFCVMSPLSLHVWPLLGDIFRLSSDDDIGDLLLPFLQ